MTPKQQQQFLKSLNRTQIEIIAHEWSLWARPKQLPPALPWRVWLLMAGRGFGKTRAGAEWVRAMAMAGVKGQIALVGETDDDTRHVMVEGPSGVLRIAPRHERPQWLPSRRMLVWPNGVVGRCYSAVDPEQLRGPEHSLAWCDEIAKWPYQATWDNLVLGLRIGDMPRIVATTTPRPKPWLKELASEQGVVVTTGKTVENSVHLAPGFINAVQQRYGHLAMGRQELEGVLITDNPDALWQRSDLVALRRDAPSREDLALVVVGVDPALGGGDETGIIVAGRDRENHIWILEDASLRASPHEWAARIVQASRRWRARRVVVEVNQGGVLVTETLKAKGVRLPIEPVRAVQGKTRRAEPVAAAYGEGLVSHGGIFERLEDQMCACIPGQVMTPSPDRLDAMVWAVTTLLRNRQPEIKTLSF